MMKYLIKKGFKHISALGTLEVYLVINILTLFFGRNILALKLFISLIAVLIIVFGIRYFYRKPRPNGQVDYSSVLKMLDSGSFISVHSARAVILALFFSPFLSLNALVFTWIVASLVVLSRLYLDKHDMVDAILGIILGYVVFFLVNLIVNII